MVGSWGGGGTRSVVAHRGTDVITQSGIAAGGLGSDVGGKLDHFVSYACTANSRVGERCQATFVRRMVILEPGEEIMNWSEDSI